MNSRITLILKILALGLALCGLVLAVFFWQWQLISETGPTWMGITVGVTSQNDVLSLLGEPYEIEPSESGIVYVYSEDPVLRGHRIVMKQGIVDTIEEDTLQYTQTVLLTTLVQQYGKPEIIEWSQWDPGYRVVVYPRLGILAEVIAFSYEKARITTIVYFRPRTSFRAFLDFSSWFSSTDPFPTADVVGSKDPWFGTSDACRPPCK